VKSITTGEGGAVTTNDAGLAEALRRVRSHGVVAHPEAGGWYYEVEQLGFNYRLSDIHAALGASQLTKLDRFVARRRILASRYRDLLAGLPVELPPDAPAGYTHASHLFAVRTADRRRVYDQLRADGIGVQVHYVPIHHHPVFAGVATSILSETEAAYGRLLSLPLFPDMTEAEQDLVVERLSAAL
jgi:dTDP-4-amino-4,6-dideoxygalactose transaminase